MPCQVIRLRKKLSGATSVVRGLFGAGESQDEAVEKLELLQSRVGGGGKARVCAREGGARVWALGRRPAACLPTAPPPPPSVYR